uniref:Peptidase_M16 domain-containing protein n=1 Tax=Angiostrongylus cantonensis TaxID=6313 RepID=A0A0K0DFE2_ANGCA
MICRFWTKSEVLMNGTIKISLYRSTRSRLAVAVGDVPGPMVKGCISFGSLVTETDCDDGLPHTLEHLVFLGSKKYPFKGVLDMIASRCLASGTNAWTDQDHTAYTLSTVGSEGFFKVLPVYLNHLLSPMLTKSQFATEVHHINGNGEDAGVVYSEMQDHESEMSCMMDRKKKEVLYPPNNCYRVDTGGRLPSLRTTCNLDKVRGFHRKFYHLSNMMIIVAGKINHERLLNTIEATEEEHLPDVPATFQRPFSINLKPPVESSEHHVLCPSEDESRGMVQISWFGYQPTDFQEEAAFEVLFDYLSYTPVSPLQREFVLIEKPLASYVSFHVTEQTTCLIDLIFSGVPTDRLDDVKKEFMDKVVKEHLEDKTWDLERMGFLVDQSAKNELKKMEKKPATELFKHMISHQLYGSKEDQLKTRVNKLELIRRLRSEPASFWSGLIKKYFVNPHVVIIGVPSEKMVAEVSIAILSASVKVANGEKSRLEIQRKKLGEDGVKQCGEQIEMAMKENTSRKPSTELLDEMIVKKLEAFDRFPVDARCNIEGSIPSQEMAKFLKQFPFPTTVHNCPTKFVELFLLFDSSILTMEHRAYLHLYTELLFESPAIINGKLKSAEDVARVVIFIHFFRVYLQVDAETGFPHLAKWAEIFTTGIVFDIQRIKQCAKKLASEAREKKRDGCSVAGIALASMLYQQSKWFFFKPKFLDSNGHMYNELVLEKFHERVAKMCDAQPKEVIRNIEEVCFLSLSGIL